tara:strand:- start:282 stop:665 length:384 start_codon:yes stop_codon:yes gene_type:complete
MKKILIFFSLIYIFSCTKNNEEDFFDSQFETECDNNDVYYISSDPSKSISNIITNKCLGCHFKNSGIVDFETYEDLILVTNLIYRINLDSNDPLVMPQAGYPQLTDCEISQLTSWVNNGSLYDEAQR